MATKETGRTVAPPPPPPPPLLPSLSRCFIAAHNPGVDPENKLLRLRRVAAEFESAAGLHVAAASAGDQSPHSPHSLRSGPPHGPHAHAPGRCRGSRSGGRAPLCASVAVFRFGNRLVRIAAVSAPPQVRVRGRNGIFKSIISVFTGIMRRVQSGSADPAAMCLCRF